MLNIVEPIIRTVISFSLLLWYYTYVFPLNLLKNMSNNSLTILIGSISLKKPTTQDDQLDAAGACPATCTRNTMTRNGDSVYDDATLFEFLF
jgi:hypothetical protein